MRGAPGGVGASRLRVLVVSIMADAIREAALMQLYGWLVSLDGEWILWFYALGRSRPWRVPWPAARSARPAAWERLAAVLLAAPGEGEVRLRQVGAPRSQTWCVPWPGPADLFSGLEPPPAVQPVVVSQTATGEEQGRPAELPGLKLRLVEAEELVVPRRANEQCAKEILKILYQTQKRQSAADLEIIMGKSDSDCYAWSKCVIEASASWLKNTLGAIDNGRDRRGQGYGLLRWDTDPCPDETA